MLEAARTLSKQPDPFEPETPDRRAFLRVVVYGGVVAGAAGLGLVAQIPVASGAKGPETLPLLPMAGLAKLEKDKPVPVEITLSRRDGWRVRSRTQRVYFLRTGDGDKAAAFSAFSAVCPHAGCEVGFHDKQYVCPCHNAKFDAAGVKLSGPAPRGLDPLALSVAEREGASWLFVAWQEFVVGIEDRVPKTT